ncbi:MAG TPA: sulfite exporter TauE/SafE family protein [Acidimicrobiales bacterium]|nr:sulfite exporter TauE/SafE family protein [Acidimicrobiales bacterium]
MAVDPYVILGSAVVGALVGLTGAGGGALMTPMLIFLFSVKAPTAISSDLVAALVMRPFGAAIHMRSRNVNLRLVAWMACGSVPAAFAGSYLLHLLGRTDPSQRYVEMALGAALLLGAAAMGVRRVLDARSGRNRLAAVGDVTVRPLHTLFIGAVGGLIVGLTSVGAGSLMIVLLMFLYPTLGAGGLVGTDLTQAIPLTAAAALGAVLFGHVAVPVTASIVAGAVPAVIAGSLLSSRVPDRYLRPVITVVILASGLKYIGVGSGELGVALLVMLVLLGAVLVTRLRSAPRLAAVTLPSE